MPPMKKPLRGSARRHTLTHLAQRWHISRREVRRLLQSGMLPFEQICGKLCVADAEARRYERQVHRTGQRHH